MESSYSADCVSYAPPGASDPTMVARVPKPRTSSSSLPSPMTLMPSTIHVASCGFQRSRAASVRKAFAAA